MALILGPKALALVLIEDESWLALVLGPKALALVLIEDESWLALILGPKALALVLIEDEPWLALVLLGAVTAPGGMREDTAGSGRLWGPNAGGELAWLPACGSREFVFIEAGHHVWWTLRRYR